AADAGAGPERDVCGAEDLLVLEDVAGQRRAFVRADAQLREVAALRCVRVERGEERRIRRAGQRTVAYLDPQRLGLQARERFAAGDDRALAAGGRDEALATGEVAERGGR